jgi:hypothetical protein
MLSDAGVLIHGPEIGFARAAWEGSGSFQASLLLPLQIVEPPLGQRLVDPKFNGHSRCARYSKNEIKSVYVHRVYCFAILSLFLTIVNATIKTIVLMMPPVPAMVELDSLGRMARRSDDQDAPEFHGLVFGIEGYDGPN